MSLDQIFHDGFVAWTTRHREELDRWEAVEKAALASLVDFHRRGIGQVVRQARVRLIVAAGEWPGERDPDRMAILQAMRNRQWSRYLHQINPLYDAVAARIEKHARLVDQPLTQETP